MNEKKIAVVTGSRRGIGLGILKAFLQEGYHGIMTGVSSQEDTKEILKGLREQDFSVEYIRCDSACKEDRERLVEYVQEKYKRWDVLVNNAGVAPVSRMDILETTEKSYDHLLDTNLKATFFLCQTAANIMIAMREKGCDYTPRIVNISSVSSYTSSVNRGEYCISKAGISMVTKLFADRLSEYGIPVFEVQPGIILTDMTEGVREKYEEKIRDGLIPWGRMGYPEDVANCVMAAAGGLLDFATGQILHADGGFHIRRL